MARPVPRPAILSYWLGLIMKKSCNALLALLAISIPVTAGCTGSSSPSPAVNSAGAQVAGDGTKQLTLPVIPKSTSGEFWETVEQGARDAAKDLNVAIKWEGALMETEIAEQNKIIENMLNLGVDGMAIAPLNNKATRKPIEDVVAAGIPVVVFDSAVDGNAHISYVATDNKAGGALAAKA